MKKIFFLFAFICINSFLSAQIIRTIAGNHANGYSGDGGPALSAQLNKPRGVAVDTSGNVFIADIFNHVVRKVNSSGIITNYAGNGIQGYSGDGGQAVLAKLGTPNSLAFDSKGNLFICDGYANVIRRIDPSGIISTVVGTGATGYNGDGGLATLADLDKPFNVTLDKYDNLYFSDTYNHVVRKVDTLGIITTIAGTGFGSGTSTGGYSGNGGPAISAQLNLPAGIAIDKYGSIYIAEQNNQTVRKIDTLGIISVFAGMGPSNWGYSGNGGQATAARLMWPSSLAFDPFGNLIIADYGNQVIRSVNSAGVINTIAGNHSQGYSGDGGPAVLATFYNPMDLTVDRYGNIYIADMDNNVIRETGTCLPPTPSICMVQVDSLSQNNIIYWDKTGLTADTFYVYRDTANNNYALIGKVPYDSLSMFTDTARSLYAANGDPNASSWRYKISYSNICNSGRVMSPMSPWHQTLFMINSGSSFMWTMYQIEGQSLPVPGLQGYLFERDDLGTGNYNLIQTLSASSTLYTDAQYATYQNTANWRVETKWNTACTPTFRQGNSGALGTVVKSRSNVKNNRQIGLLDFFQNKNTFFPNPANNELTVLLSRSCNNCRIQITNTLGQEVKSGSISGSEAKLSLADLQNGVYLVKITGNGSSSQQKLVIQH